MYQVAALPEDTAEVYPCLLLTRPLMGLPTTISLPCEDLGWVYLVPLASSVSRSTLHLAKQLLEQGSRWRVSR